LREGGGEGRTGSRRISRLMAGTGWDLDLLEREEACDTLDLADAFDFLRTEFGGAEDLDFFDVDFLEEMVEWEDFGRSREGDGAVPF